MAEGPNILVTGGAGYIGSVLVPELLAAGHRVTVLDNFTHRQNSLAHVCHDPNFEVVNGDAADEATVRPLAKRADVMIPLAALVGAPACDRDPIGSRRINYEAVAMLAKMLGGDQRILLPVTNSGYGVGETGKLCTEETPLRPVSRYGIDKVAAEAALFEFKNAVSFRLATVFGFAPRMRIDLLVNDFVYRAVHDRAVVLFESHFKRNYIHVRDVARVFIFAIENPDSLAPGPYNVGLSDANISKRELCEKIREHLPAFAFLEAEIGEDPDKRDYIVSNAKIEATGWRPRYSLDDGIRELIKGYRMIRNTVYGNA
jgi:nucleoside-diphosphate-sugar epimerase